MKVSKKEDFAILLMTVLAENYSIKYIPLSFVSRKTGLSPLFLKHIALELKNKGLIESREGTLGGYRLNQTPDSISAAQIINAVSEGSIVKISCTKKTCVVGRDNCICFVFWGNFNRKMYSYLENVKLSEIAGL
ncbi:hypothetical protein A3I80_04610 [Candidatus Gottesmanbacteria bacterium RIFCSPLOWO2_02_FULL_40_10]|nr:MAG: hypothetical protein A3I80_04610 [Candidatus Gottesmanbacteria bacterium RIFCSPLOWO2_02_FULL_40_10]